MSIKRSGLPKPRQRIASVLSMSRPSLSFACLLLCIVRVTLASCAQYPCHTSSSDWEELGKRVNGRLFPGVPFSKPCFENHNSSGCHAVEMGYTNDTFRSQYFGAYVNTNWEACQATGSSCLLDYRDPTDITPVLPPNQCSLGSVPNYYIDVRTHEDVAAAFEFSKKTKVPLVIKNTGHDYKGRSSGPNTLALWTHNLKNISYNPEFIPDGCTTPSPGVTVGAGIQWGEAYPFAEAHNITIVGGSDKGVGVSGGWLQGGGHGALTNTMGMGVDRVLQFKVVTPDGQYRIANACQNQDLFFALRGGGGGTFGVVLESTTLASPPVTLQVVVVTWTNPNSTLTESLWSILVDNAVKWADEGWGGFVAGQSVIYLTPKLNKEQAAESMKPVIDFGGKLKQDGVAGAQLLILEFPTWYTFFNTFANTDSADIGQNLALTSQLLSALLNAHSIAPGLRFLVSPPTSFKGDGETSITEAWRDSIYHITLVENWLWNATTEEIKGHYQDASRAIDFLRNITPDAAYSNEADVHEPNHEVAFWGSNYAKLLSIKRRYDPDHLLNCWQCVGWNAYSPRFSCYI